MGNNIYAQLHCGTALIYGSNLTEITCLEKEYVRIHSESSLTGLILEISIAKLKLCLYQILDQCKAMPAVINLVYYNNQHKQWLNELDQTKIAIIYVDIINKQKQQKQINQKVFNFCTKLSLLDFQKQVDSAKNYRQQLPQHYLKLQTHKRVQIFEINNGMKILLYYSNLDQNFHYKLISKVLNQNKSQLIYRPINQIIENILQKGNNYAADLLVEDIFGKENCQFIGLPPKLIACSMAKTPSNSQIVFYDQLKSILTAFAINLGLQIKQQMLKTHVNLTVVQTNQFSNPLFLRLMEALPSFFGEIWFKNDTIIQKFASRILLYL